MSKEKAWKKHQPVLAALKAQTPVKVTRRRAGRTSAASEHLLATRQTEFEIDWRKGNGSNGYS